MEEIRELVEQEEQEGYDDDGDVKPWHVLLEPAARAAWRTSDQSPPEKWVSKRQEILQLTDMTTKQLKRSHHLVLRSHRALMDRRDRERIRQKLHKTHKKDSLAGKHENQRDAAATSVFYKSEQTFATLQHRLLPNYAIVRRVLLEAQALLPGFQPKRVLDYGIGVGSASAAALDVFDDIDWIHGIDSSTSMRDCAEKLLDINNSPTRVTTDASLTSKSGKGTFDMILFAYTATELPNPAATMAAAAVLWEKLAPNGVFIMVEPGTPDGFSSIRSVRTMLLDCCPPEPDENDEEDEELAEELAALDQCHIIAPCTHNGECPMERYRRVLKPTVEGKEINEIDEDDDDEIEEAEYTEEEGPPVRGITETDAFDAGYCSFVHNIPGSPGGHKGDKLSYLVAQKRYRDSPSVEAPFSNVAQLLAETYRSTNDLDPENYEVMLDEADQAMTKFANMEDKDPLGLSIVVGETNRRSFGRIVRAPLKRKGHIMVDYCAAGDDEEGKGHIVRHRLGKSSSEKIAPGLYAAARKARWGGLWPDVIDKIN